MNKTKKINPNESDITDLNNKMVMVYKILQICIKEKNNSQDNVKTTLDRLVLFTGLPKHIVCKIWDNTKIPESIQNLSYVVPASLSIDRARKALITHYVKFNKIPTVKSLQEIFPNVSPLQIRQFFKRNGFIWKQLPNTKRAIIVERPERVIQRQRYLQQMDYYRQQKRCIVYVEEKIINECFPETDFFQKYTKNIPNTYVVLVTVASKTGYMGGTVITESSILRCQKLIEEYLLKHILPRLPKSSVIVLEDRRNLCTSLSLSIPTIESTKSSMIDWLKTNNIPFNEKSHRGELLELIENYKIKRDLHKFDAMTYGRGHEIIRRPQKTNYLDYFKLLWKDIFGTGEKTFTNDMVSNKPPDYWLQLENKLVDYESVVYKDDLDMENVVDKILTMAQYEKKNYEIKKWADDECDEEKDTLKQEEYLIHSSIFL